MKLIQITTDNVNFLNKELTLEDIMKEFPTVFQGLGQMPGEYKIELKENATPVVHPPRKVPIIVKPSLKSKLDEMEKFKIIASVQEPTDWVSSVVVVAKPNKLRVCIDPRDLNKVIKRSHHPLPTIEDTIADLAKAKVFSVLDAKDGFWQVKLTTESSYLTTFNTPFGRYRWLRMPFGISSATEEF